MKIQKHGYNLLMVLAVPTVAAVALLDLGVIADASCQLSWGPSELTCTVAQGSPNTGHFSYGQTTEWASAGKGAWTVSQAISWPLGSNIQNVGCNPSSVDVGDN